MADLIAQLPQHRLIGIIEQDIPYGHKLAHMMRSALTDCGSVHLTFPCRENGLNHTDLSHLVRAGVDAVVVAGIHELAAVCCKQLQAIGYTMPLFLGDDSFTPNLLALAGDTAEGARMVAPGPAYDHDASTIELTERYRKLIGVEPGAYFLTSYTATSILLAALGGENVQNGRSFANQLRGQSWRTPIGDLRFDEKGEIEGLESTIYQVQDGRFVPQRTVKVRNAQQRPGR
jgi:branched-chain amino acid transport system substrate-binding protein